LHALSRDNVLLIIILIVAAIVRVNGLTAESTWVDEFIALKHAAGRPLNAPLPDRPNDVLLQPAPSPASLVDALPWYRSWTSVRDDVHPPLYFVALRLWLNLFGDSDAAARMLSVVCSLIAIALFYDTCRVLHGSTIALWAATLMALALTQIRYAQEARNYAMITALAMLACCAAVRIERRGGNRRRYLALLVSIVLMPLTHYVAIVPMAALAGYLFLRISVRAERRRLLAVFAAGAAIFALIGAPILWHQRANAEQTSLRFDRERGRGQRIVERIATTPARYIDDLLDPNPLTTQPSIRALWLVVPVVIVYLLPLLLLRRRPDLLLWIVWLIAALAPIALGDLVRQTGNLQLIRFVLLGAPAAYALIAACLQHARWRMVTGALPACAIGLALLALPQKTRSLKPDYRQLVAQIRSMCTSDDAIIVAGADPGPWYLKTMYQGVMRYMYPSPCPIAVVTHTADTKLLDELRTRRTLWVVWGSQTLDPARLLPGARYQVIGEYRNLAYLMRVTLATPSE
jgi:hypothetical protein